MNSRTGKLVYTSCLFSSILGILLCASVITADKLSSDLAANIIENQLAQVELDNHKTLSNLHSDKIHRT